MKKILCILVLLGMQLSYSQDKIVSVEKTIFGIQSGLLGIWAHNESRLSNEFALRSEVGLNFGLIGGEVNGGTKFISAPGFSVEPRWYYNLEKRNNKGKSILNNSANFFTVNFGYIPNKETSSFYVPQQFTIIPKWGIKRSINHFTYELGIGLGYRKYLETNYSKTSDAAVDLHLRLGYTF